MFKRSIKSIYFLIISITFLVLIVEIIVDYIILLSNPTYFDKVLIFAISSIFLGSCISSGIYLLDPTVSENTTTLKKMLRAESLSNPLLLRLSTKAPGTYHHSLNVSTLAQRAAKSIGANSFLVRIAAYYHDIGKIEKPSQYIENQRKNKKVTRLNGDYEILEENAQKIISHVEDGVVLAKKYNLPEEIIDLIKEHHGTTHASYFFDIAKEKGLNIQQQNFRYPGPRPQSKESVILMLSDCVEAIARSMVAPTEAKLKKMVRDTIKNKLSDHQISGAGLSDGELRKIEISLTETLCSIYHQRINYDDRNN